MNHDPEVLFMQRKNTHFFLFIITSGILPALQACSNGELPTALAPPQELYAPFIANEQDLPVLDGRREEAAWKSAPVYRVFLNNQNGGVNLPARGILTEWQAVWWRVIVKITPVNSTRSDTAFASHVGIVVTWPDADKNLDPQPWSYDPATATWSQNRQGVDWLLITWPTAAVHLDLWFWDAARTNPMGYFQDMVLEGMIEGNRVVPLHVAIDGLNFFNDRDSLRNTWDANYNDNNTPRDSSDDRPRWAWKDDPEMTPPPLPPVYSSRDENRRFLLDSVAVLLAQSAYANPRTAVAVPGAVLQRPAGSAADIRAFGRHENGRWTLEFVRRAKASDGHDVVLNPTARYFSQSLAVALGNNAATPFDRAAAPFNIDNSLMLSFEFRR